SIIAVLATLVIFISPSNGIQRGGMGASQVQGWLLIQKQRAFRDRIARGVRLVPDPTNSNWITSLLAIEQPDDLSVGYISQPAAVGNTSLTFTLPLGMSFNGLVTANSDYLVINQDTYLITGIDSTGTIVSISPGLQENVYPALAQYRIVRSARTVLGE